ncbi:hypothetical protein F5Y04DRAFT_291727 [Hypomontagnella monticulosa]|nr:hypothetical protein F5Y04DRAFT_291727 [Hypomontagnella monticulosa]
MQQSFCDGLPVDHSSTCNAALNKSRNCATQSTGGSTDLPNPDAYYIPSPTVPVSDLGHRSRAQPLSSSHFPMTINTSIPTYQRAQVHSASSSSQGVWPTPPSTTCEGEDLDGYSYNGSPISGNCRVQTVAPCSANSSVASPRSWSPRETQQVQYQQTYFKESDHMPPYNFRNYPSLQYDQQIQPQMASSSYESPSFMGTSLNTSAVSQLGIPSMASGLAEPDTVVVSQSESPQLKQDPDESYGSYGTDDVSKQPRQASQPTGEEGGKVDEPYAQHIHKAFIKKGAPHQMTLQEIYRYFLEYTDKGKDAGNKGWQNSIRHNLSMNKAFAKREITDAEGKKMSVWALEEWAIDGVQSTTRYRSKGPSNRRGGLISHSRTNAHLSGRANSGRKGGICASKSKAAATKKAILNQRHHSSAFHNNNAHHLHTQMQHAGYGPHLGLQYHLPTLPRDGAITPPDHTHEGMMLGANTMQATMLPNSDANHGFAFTPNLPQYGQNNHSHVYTLEDVAGIYQGDTAPAPTPDLNALFWNESGAGAQYQP